MNLIDRDELLKQATTYDEGGWSTQQRAVKVEDILAAPVIGGWISINDRLPKNGEYVLCWYEYFRYGNYDRMFQTHGIGYCYNGNWYGEVSNGQNARVLYWMPLPNPPKED